MGLLADIQSDLVTPSIPLSAVLRKCRVLAHRLGSDLLRNWVLHESDGYPDDAELPSYRKLDCMVVGHFSGPFGSSLRNAVIPPYLIPDKIRTLATELRLGSSVAEIECLLAGDLSNGLKSPLPGNWVAYLGTRVYDGMNCLSAWRDVPVQTLSGILNVVRNRTLDLVLELERVDPNAGEPSMEARIVTPSQATQIFHTIVYGGSANVTGSAVESTITASSRVIGDLVALRVELGRLGVPPAEIDTLEEAIKDDGPRSSQDKRFGPKVAKWLQSTAASVASGAVTGGATVVATVLAKAVSAYYGFPTSGGD